MARLRIENVGCYLDKRSASTNTQTVASVVPASNVGMQATLVKVDELRCSQVVDVRTKVGRCFERVEKLLAVYSHLRKV